ncbi:5-formyltetrahydrofolate cyclo-ligase [Spirosoma radiotolerans]|uniref:5-formyltetrahydrofolate cyclo-ligase n=1 Tax=Spirosoma radiotolerans TaxID=1379870 RepID=A0A0E3ZZZ1_9BACT|nr:5-formyltetrahydrofolate cyclo-ligase [Spirosoma radiotolerans]AKD57829.1 5-formyltetrahydrofolate cyclo-ligase [Spirosoma radiotolerans]
MTKAELRQAFLAKRKAFTAAEVSRDSQRIANNFFTYLEQHDLDDSLAVVHTFLPIKRRNEVDTWPIINQIWTNFPHIQVSVPVTDEYTNQLINYTLFPSTALVESRLGIPEPAIGSRYETDLTQVSIVLVPLLVFDQSGHRVGYGGGYYDRFLANDVPHSLKIGLSLFEPVEQIDDLEYTDVKLDVCISPTQTSIFN